MGAWSMVVTLWQRFEYFVLLVYMHVALFVVFNEYYYLFFGLLIFKV